MSYYKLEVSAVGAYDLSIVESDDGKMDPYCVCRLPRGTARMSSVCTDGHCDPVWNEKWYLGFNDPSMAYLSIQVQNRNLNAAELIGKTHIALKEVAGDGYAVQERFPLFALDGKTVAGSIELKLCLYPPLNVEESIVDPEVKKYFDAIEIPSEINAGYAPCDCGESVLVEEGASSITCTKCAAVMNIIITGGTDTLETPRTLLNSAEYREMEARNAFEEHDADGSGCISTDELKKILLALQFDPEYVDDELVRGDLDGDGKLSFHEFSIWYNLISEFQNQPSYYVEKFDSDEDANYYLNLRTGITTWEHPLEVNNESSYGVPEDYSLETSWARVYDSDTCYYHNIETEESVTEMPEDFLEPGCWSSYYMETREETTI